MSVRKETKTHTDRDTHTHTHNVRTQQTDGNIHTHAQEFYHKKGLVDTHFTGTILSANEQFFRDDSRLYTIGARTKQVLHDILLLRLLLSTTIIRIRRR